MKHDMYNLFDTPVNRVGTECIKWDGRADFGNAEALPMWVADMDFRTADGIIEALEDRVRHGVFGYATNDPKDKQAVVQWMKTRHACDVKDEWILYSPGVVDSIYHILKAVVPEGGRVVIQTPVYGPFHSMTRKANMQLVENPLLLKNGRWEMDFDGLEAIFKEGAQAIILCSPHNPVGRVWTAEELGRLVSLCNRYHVRVISDEIHADFELRGARHTPILTVPGAENAVMLISATKTFNLAALRHSTILCPDAETRGKIKDNLNEVMADVNLFGRLATRAAYTTGGEWLDALLEYLSDGRDILFEGLKAIPGLKPTCPEGTYLMWVDCSQLGLEGDALNEFFIKKCGVIPSGGAFFGTQGNSFIRLNFATPHANLREAVRRIERAVADR